MEKKKEKMARRILAAVCAFVSIATLMFVFPVLALDHNPFEESINTIAEFNAWEPDQVSMRKGTFHLTLFSVKTQLELRVNDAGVYRDVSARLVRPMFSNYRILCYSADQSSQC